ncbi:MAG: CDP-glycerol glycerophosphotransferase family protein [Eubacterium sp.]|nr:CDP-glycerol glycerophosphotransferase family protein [Eubacterium sp.]
MEFTIKDLSIEENKMDISIMLHFDKYLPGVTEPRVILCFDNGTDERRLPILINACYPDVAGEGATAFGLYQYTFENVFWNCAWKECDIRFEVEYGPESSDAVAFTFDNPKSVDKQASQKGETLLHINLNEPIDATIPDNPGVGKVFLGMVINAVNILLGICLIPWFILDCLGIMFLGTEKRNETIEGSLKKQFVYYVGWRYFGFNRITNGVKGVKEKIFTLIHLWQDALHPHKEGVLFLSVRRNDMTGNFEYVYDELKRLDPNIKITKWLHAEEIQEIKIRTLIEMVKKIARAKVIIVDDFVPYLSQINVSSKSKVVQLWHACGAFKTFGFSRLGKKGGPTQKSKNHRDYDYVFVSSEHIGKYYAEGFGVADHKVYSLGVPRTDIFFSETYKKKITEQIYQNYPFLKDKKILLFAPTFRGNGKKTAYYDKDAFDPNRVIGALSDEYVLLIKHHPFVQMKYQVKPENEGRIFDFSQESEINELLFITDVLITDYSSVIYEASLLNLPILFYAYDVQEYIAYRDFYARDFNEFVPGKIVRDEKSMIQAIIEKDFEHEKVQTFSYKNFDIQDGKSSQRVAQKILDIALDR